MRFRENVNAPADLVEFVTWDWATSLGTTQQTTDYYSPTYAYDAMWDVVTPGFHKKRNKGEIVNNPMFHSYGALETKLARYDYSGVVYYGEPNEYSFESYLQHTKTFASTICFTDVEVAAYCDQFETERDIAVTKAWANVDLSEMQALATLGELPETLRWIATNYRRINILLRKQKRKRLLLAAKRFGKTASSHADDVSKFWLEFRYAIRPLVFDMESAVKAASAQIKKGNRITARGYHHVDVEETEYSYPVVVGTATAKYGHTTKRTSSYRAGVLYEIDTNINAHISLWGLDQPVEALWEITRGSFIVDWLLNVGDTISSWAISSSLRPLTSWVTEEHREIQSYRNHGLETIRPDTSTTIFGNQSYSGGESTLTRRIKRRTVCPDRAILPTVKLNLDMAKILDLAAISRQIFKAIKKIK